MRVQFDCPNCEAPTRSPLPGDPDWQCGNCGQVLNLDRQVDETIPLCIICGNKELYKKKDFPHTLGMYILVIACAISFYTYLNYWVIATWVILTGTAVFDGVLFMLVGDAVVCYRCQAHYRGIPKSVHEPFEISVGEKYRQERMRMGK